MTLLSSPRAQRDGRGRTEMGEYSIFPDRSLISLPEEPLLQESRECRQTVVLASLMNLMEYSSST